MRKMENGQGLSDEHQYVESVQSLKITCISQYCFRKFAAFIEIIDGLLKVTTPNDIL